MIVEVSSGRLNRALGFMDDDGTLYITNVTVRSKDRHRGLGQTLVRQLIKKAKPKEVLAVYIVPESSGFWEKLGIEEGRHKFYDDANLVAERDRYLQELHD